MISKKRWGPTLLLRGSLLQQSGGDSSTFQIVVMARSRKTRIPAPSVPRAKKAKGLKDPLKTRRDKRRRPLPVSVINLLCLLGFLLYVNR